MGGLTGYLYETTLSNGYFNGNVRGSGDDHVVAGMPPVASMAPFALRGHECS
jgi:hypothetical protein